MPAEVLTDQNPFHIVRQWKPLSFCGELSQDVDDSLSGFQRVSDQNGIYDTSNLANVIFYLRGTARTSVQKHEVEIQSSHGFPNALSTFNYAAKNRRHLSSDTFATRA